MKKYVGFFFVFLCVYLASAAWADDAGQAARDLVTKYQASIVTLKITAKLKMTMMGETSSEEMKDEGIGVVVDPGGLVVTSLTAVDPSEMVSKMMPADAGSDMQVSIDITDLRIHYADGTEAPASITLRDKDLDLAYILPTTKPANPLPCIDISKIGKPVIGDEFIFLYRMPQLGDRAIAISVDRVCGIIEKPRTFYVPDAMNAQMGVPAFTLDGAFIGIAAPRIGPVTTGNKEPDSLAVIVPADDVVDGVKQALDTKP